MADQKLFERQTALVKMNAEWLRQALRLLAGLDDGTFTQVPGNMAPHQVAGHMRHIIEFYECFLDGIDRLHVDYDSRRRDPLLGTSRAAAMARIEGLIDRLELDPSLREDGAIFVRLEDASALNVPEPFLMTSVGRELQALASHTIHHFALIAVTLKALGRQVAVDFGVAPSTLRYQASKAEQLVEAAA